MDPRLLRTLLPPTFAGDVPALWARYATSAADPNPYGFVAWLFHEGELAGEAAKAALTSGRAVLTLSGGPEGRVQLPSADAGLQPLGLIGRGAMGEVLVVRDPALRRTLALKRSRSDRELPPEARAAFLREAQITAQLDHPGIVSVHGFERDGDELAYTMKLVHGRTLEQRIAQATSAAMARSGAPLAEDPGLTERLEILLSVCDAISYAHAQGVVHRDLKPENIMVARYGEVLVLDWGVAALIPPERGTEPLRIVGTPLYMSPEQAFGAPFAVEPASDQYTLGLILFELISLRKANPADNPIDAIKNAREGVTQALVPAPGVRSVPRELRAIVEKATERKPGRRYGSVQELADDLRRYLRDEEVLAEPDRGLQKGQRWISHHREQALGIGLGLVLLVVLTGLGLSALGEARLAASERRAAAREESLERLGRVVSAQVSLLDRRLQHYEATLAGMVWATEEALARPGTGSPPWFGLDPDGDPDDLLPSAFYDAPTSLKAPDLWLAEGVARSEVEDQLAQLAPLGGVLRSALFRGSDVAWVQAPQEAAARVRDPGLPLVWTYVATERGVIASFPGTRSDYPDGYDHREWGWYRVGRGQPGPVWSVLEVDETGMGLLLTVSQGLHDRTGTPLGVAALDVSFGYVIDTLLQADDLDGRAELFLVDGDGKVILRSSDEAGAFDAETYTTPPFPWADRLPARRDTPGGGWTGFDADGERLLMHWHPVHSLPWTYVLVGEEGRLMETASGLEE